MGSMGHFLSIKINKHLQWERLGSNPKTVFEELKSYRIRWFQKYIHSQDDSNLLSMCVNSIVVQKGTCNFPNHFHRLWGVFPSGMHCGMFDRWRPWISIPPSQPPKKKVQKGSETASASKFLRCFLFLETCMWRNRDCVFDKTALREELIITIARNVVIQYLHHPVVVWLGLTFLSPLSVWISDWHQLCKFEWKKNEEATKQV